MKVINNPIEYAKIAVEKYRSFYGADLLSIILYGSAAGGDFDPKKSDINLLIILSEMDPVLIAGSADIQAKLFRMRFARPLFMDKAYINASCDSYPMEFLDMKGCYNVLFGEDVLATVNPEPEHLRLQIERELKGKWLYLIHEYAVAKKNKKLLMQLTRRSLKALIPVLRALLKLKGASIPYNRKELFLSVESVYSIAGRPFQAVAESSISKSPRLEQYFIDYMNAVKSLTIAIENK